MCVVVVVLFHLAFSLIIRSLFVVSSTRFDVLIVVLPRTSREPADLRESVLSDAERCPRAVRFACCES